MLLTFKANCTRDIDPPESKYFDIASFIERCQYRTMRKPSTPICCPQVLTARLRQHDADALAAAFKALADPARLRVLNFIAAQPAGEACVCHFTGLLGLSQPTVSHHLRLLYDAGLVDRERRGTW